MEYVTTDCDGCEYITAGKRYEFKGGSSGGNITDDEGDVIFITTNGPSSHLGGRSWTIHTTPSLKLEVGKTYVLNNGEKHVCEVYSTDKFAVGIYWYNEDGRCGTYDADHHLSVSHEYTQPEGKTLAELDVKAGDVVKFVDWVGTNYDKYIGLNMNVNNHGGVSFGCNNGFVSTCPHKFSIISRAADTPTLWRDMTDAEKGALLLAKHEGKAIEYLSSAGKWADWVIEFKDAFAYRIKPTPKVEVLDMTGQYHFSGTTLNNNKYRITLQFTDGKPDTASIRMEEL